MTRGLSLSRAWPCAGLALALSAWACDGLGRPLVDRRDRPSGSPGDCVDSFQADRCLELPPARAIGAPTFAVDFAACGGLDTCSEELQPDGRRPVLRRCELARTLDPAAALELPDLECARLSLELAPGASVRLQGLTLRDVQIVVSAEQPSALEIAGASLSNAQIELRGPISLRFVERSALQAVSIVEATSATPRLEFWETRATNLWITGDEQRFGGPVELVRTEVAGGTLRAAELLAESTTLSVLDIDVEQLVGVDLQGDAITLETALGELSFVKLSRLRVQRCQRLLIAGSALIEPELSPCSAGPLRMYSGDVTGGVIAGAVESNNTVWVGVSLGAGVDSSLELWRGTLASSALCENVLRLTVHDAEVTCNQCERLGSAAQEALCKVAERYALPAHANPECAALATMAQCDPLPRDERPF